MPNDPHSRRTQPAPPHPSGLSALDDAPVFVAPAVDVRPTSLARLSLVPASGVPTSHRLPAEERSAMAPPPPEADEEAPLSVAPETVDWERARKLAGVASGPMAAASLPPQVPLDEAADRAEIEAISAELGAIAALDERPDRVVDRAVVARTTLARARALRFRLALLRAWPAASPAPSPTVGALHLELTIDAMVLVALADGAPSVFGPSSPLPVASVMVGSLRALKPELSRAALRDRGVAAIARSTIVGYAGALEAIAKVAASLSTPFRALALALGARAAVASPAAHGLDEHRLGALSDLERALALPLGSTAAAIEAARRAR